MASSGSKIRVGIVGLGGMGSRWTHIARSHKDSTLIGVTDVDIKKMKYAAKELRCKTYENWNKLVLDNHIDAVVIATPHVYLTQIAQSALIRGKHVLTEKPGGASSAEIEKGIKIANKKNLRYRVNFHMRLHPAVALAKQKTDEGVIGKVIFIRGVYGHGGRAGYEKEWWCKKKLSGGGEAIDQGSHLLNLANWFIGPFESAATCLETGFWNIRPLEDNAFFLLQNKAGQTAALHASWTHWRKMFRWEIYGELGYLVVEGLGGQYGLERLTYGKQALGRSVPQEKVWEFEEESHAPDTALKNSWSEFLKSIRRGRDIGSTAKDAVETLRLVELSYRAAKAKRVMRIT